MIRSCYCDVSIQYLSNEKYCVKRIACIRTTCIIDWHFCLFTDNFKTVKYDKFSYSHKYQVTVPKGGKRSTVKDKKATHTFDIIVIKIKGFMHFELKSFNNTHCDIFAEKTKELQWKKSKELQLRTRMDPCKILSIFEIKKYTFQIIRLNTKRDIFLVYFCHYNL